MGWPGQATIVALLIISYSHYYLALPVCQEGLENLENIPDPEDCSAVCEAAGDPQFNSFDCVRFEYHGQCDYTLVKKCGGDIADFEIIGEFFRIDPDRNRSVIKKLRIITEGTTDFQGNRDKESHVTNMFNTPVTARFIRIRPTAWNRHISMRFELFGCDDLTGTCDTGSTLGMEDGRIQDDQMTSSSHWDHPTLSHGASNARLNRKHNSQSTSAWSAGRSDSNQWIQVDLLHQKQITGITTQGRSISEKQMQWVKQYQVLYSDDGNDWIDIVGQNILELDYAFGVTINGHAISTFTETIPFGTVQRYCNAVVVNLNNGVTIHWSSQFRALIQIAPESRGVFSGNVCGLCGNFNGIKSDDFTIKEYAVTDFQGNSDKESHVTNMFNTPVTARFIRIRPTGWNQHISMRFELLGCDDLIGTCDTGSTLGMEDGRIEDDQITSSSDWDHPTLFHGASNARLNRNHDSQSTSAWSAGRSDLNQWVQVDLLHQKRIEGITIQGRSISETQLQWVTRYQVLYSDGGNDWFDIRGQNVYDHDDVVTFGDSWRTEEDCQRCDDCKNTVCKMNEDHKERAHDICQIFIYGNMPFCGDFTAESFFQQCVSILCATLPENDGLCQLIMDNINVCEANGVPVDINLEVFCKSDLGCVLANELVPVGDTLLSEDCSQICTCETHAILSCTDAEKCADTEVCEIRNGVRDCFCRHGNLISDDGMCREMFTCRACGDPHYLTFDGKRYDYMGNCQYILAQSRPDAPNDFLVIGDNVRPWPNSRVTITRFVYITVYGLVVKFSWNTHDIIVNDQKTDIPYRLNDHVNIFRSGTNTILVTDFGLRVHWDGRACVHVSIPDTFVHNVEGLCGYLSRDIDDDFTNPQGDIVTDKDTFGDGWGVGDCEPCTPETCTNENPCAENPQAAAVAKEACLPLTTVNSIHACEGSTLDISCESGTFIQIKTALYGRQDSAVCPNGANIYVSSCSAPHALTIVRDRCFGEQSCSIPVFNYVFTDPCPGTTKYLQVDYFCVKDIAGPFAACLNSDEVNFADFASDCLYDVCADPEDKDLACSYIAQFADECRAHGYNVNGWRTTVSNGLCAIDCGDTKTYSDCGAANPASCANPSPATDYNLPCVQGCQCNDGLVLSGDTCVPLTECGCVSDGKNYKEGDSFTNDDCYRCTCTSASLVCEDISCDVNAGCKIQDNARECVCNVGFEGDGLSCTEKQCLLDGEFIAIGDSSLSRDCSQRCRCADDATLTCVDAEGCTSGEVCEERDGTRDCFCKPGSFISEEGVCQEVFACRACGDPHYLTFDGKRYDYMGNCQYILAQSRPDAPNEFLVIGDNVRPRPNSRVTITRFVYITVYGLEVKFSWNTHDIIVNDLKENLPFRLNDQVDIFRSGTNTILVTDFGLRVHWDGRACVHVSIPDTFVHSVEGLCGYLSRDVDDDFTNPQGDIETDKDTFGDGWGVGDCEPCTPETCTSENPCAENPQASAAATEACLPLAIVNTIYACELNSLDISCDSGTYIQIRTAMFGRRDSTLCYGANMHVNTCSAPNALTIVRGRCTGEQSCTINVSTGVFGDPCLETKKYLQVEYYCVKDVTGPFAECLNSEKVSPADFTSDCLYDVCADPEDTDTACSYIAQFADECRAHGFNVNGWRTTVLEGLCDIDCGESSTYSDCGAANPASCANPSPVTDYNLPCVQGCQCNDGLVLSGDTCVPLTECGCVSDGKYLKEGELFVNDDCSSRCTCTSASLVCEDISCDVNAACKIQDNVRECVCNVGFEGDGLSCTGEKCVFGENEISIGDTSLNDDCTQLCTCETGAILSCEDVEGCTNGETCETRDGTRACSCKQGNFISDGVCQETFTCRACGDPHYTTFDGRRYDYQGKCYYVLARARPDAPNDFLVIGDNVQPPHNTRVTITRFVFIFVYGLGVRFSWNTLDVIVNDVKMNLPFRLNDQVDIFRSGRNTVLVTDFGLRVNWDGRSCVYISIPSAFLYQVEGLCGYLSKDPSDDLQNPQGEIENDRNRFGDSWGFGDTCEPCTPETCLTGNPCEDDPEAFAIAAQVCSPLTDHYGPFEAALNVFDPVDLVADCLYDLCVEPDEKDQACEYFERFVDEIHAKGVTIDGWRDQIHQGLCAIDCGDTKTYSDCGAANPASCTNPSPATDYNLPCVQGCQCNDGLVLSGDTCVPLSECGCVSDGKYYKEGDSFTNDDCSSRCTCTSASLICEDISCDVNAACKIQNNVRVCVCNVGFEGDGLSCTVKNGPCDQPTNPCQNHGVCVSADNDEGFVCRCPEGWTGEMCAERQLTCRASGDPHYLNYDNKKFDFQGNCEYIFTKNCNNEIPEFSVLVDNIKSARNNRVSLTRSVTLNANGDTIILGQNKLVEINGEKVVLPIHQSMYDVFLTGEVVVIQTAFHLTVEYNGRSTVKVKVPDSFRGNVCGLCGDGQWNNDMVTSEGEQETNVNVWGHTWAVNQDTCAMCDDCPTTDACDGADPEIINIAQQQCHIITATSGYMPIKTDPANLFDLDEFLNGIDWYGNNDVFQTRRRKRSTSNSNGPNPVHIGCFVDMLFSRALPNHRLTADDMTLEKCWQHCASFGDQRYAGLQRGEICYCGSVNDDYSKYGQVEEDVCGYACVGNAEQKCGGLISNSVYDLGGGPFDKCHPVVDPQDFFKDCRYDWCANEGPDTLCETIADYAEACQLRGIEIMDWRAVMTGHQCAFDCPSHSHYELCAYPCQATCANPNAADEPCAALCREGWVCDDGYLWDGESCVQASSCNL